MDAALSRARCAEQLRQLGVAEGDVILVRAALSAIGPVEAGANRAEFLIDALLDVIGPQGLLLGLAFTKNDWVFRFRKRAAFDVSEPCITGGFAAAMLNHPKAVRSLHPTNSFVAIGHGAAAVMALHGPETPCFAPIETLLQKRGKMLLVGCGQTSPGFSTVHWVQRRLGLDTKTWMGLILGRRYKKPDGSTAWHAKRDVPGCSMGFGKFYDVYRQAGILHEGKLGQADCMLVAAQAAFDAEHAVLCRTPQFALCDRAGCISCRLGWFYKRIEVFRFLRARLCGQRHGA